jgi:hypothetical protein
MLVFRILSFSIRSARCANSARSIVLLGFFENLGFSVSFYFPSNPLINCLRFSIVYHPND